MNTSNIINTIQDLNKYVRNGGLLVGMKVIWDSGFGYEIGYVTKKEWCGNINAKLVTGINSGEIRDYVFHFTQYSEEKLNEMIKKYKY